MWARGQLTSSLRTLERAALLSLHPCIITTAALPRTVCEGQNVLYLHRPRSLPYAPDTQTPEHLKRSFYGWGTAFYYYDCFLRIPRMRAESASLLLSALALQLRPLPLKLRTSSPWPPLYTHAYTDPHTHPTESIECCSHVHVLGVTSWEWIHAYYFVIIIWVFCCFWFIVFIFFLWQTYVVQDDLKLKNTLPQSKCWD